MPNAPVPATAGGMSKFTARPSTVAGRRKWFANALRSAWETIKQAAAEAVKPASQRAAERVEQIKRRMHALDMRPFRHAISSDRKSFVAELAALTAHATRLSSMAGERA